MKTLHQPSDRFWTQYGTVSAAVTPDEARHLIQQIAAEIGCKATICQSPADYASENERVIDSLNETGADDRPAVDEAPFVDGFSWPGYDYRDGSEAGTRAIISGGEVMELGPQENDRDIPF
jgi:hypothetical protein